MKVSAIDPQTGVEVSIVGSPKATQKELTRLAVRKLLYVLEKEHDSEDMEKNSPPDKGKGIVI